MAVATPSFNAVQNEGVNEGVLVSPNHEFLLI